jgi:hypothetical protein
MQEKNVKNNKIFLYFSKNCVIICKNEVFERETEMTLKEVGIIIGKDLRFLRQYNSILVFFADTEIKEGELLRSVHGVGKTKLLAQEDYCKKIRGQTLVTDAMSLKKRKEFILPPRITRK